MRDKVIGLIGLILGSAIVVVQMGAAGQDSARMHETGFAAWLFVGAALLGAGAYFLVRRGGGPPAGR